MPLVVFHTKRVREALQAPAKIGIDLLVLGFVIGIVGMIGLVSRQMGSPYNDGAPVHISLSPWALPKYTLFSLSRGLAAYVLSLVFTLVYGSIAAHNRRAEAVMIPALDVLQSIPVLGFLPGVVLFMIALFPNRELGLELASIIMIFTAQAWNMTFSYHGSVRNVPAALREVSRLNSFSGWKTFRQLEVPAAMIGLVWNSMMSMAGGWFFLSVTESFTLGPGKDYRLPGIGSYMQEAIDQGNQRAQWSAVVAMVVMIVAVDQLLWRPIVVWAKRFRMEEQGDSDASQSWVLSVLQHSTVLSWLGKVLSRLRPAGRQQKLVRAVRAAIQPRTEKQQTFWRNVGAVTKWGMLGGMALVAAWGAWEVARLLMHLPPHEWRTVVLALLASFARTTAAVLLGAAWALPVGIMIGRSPKWSRRLQPIVQVVASFPAPMLFPFVVFGLLAMHVPFNYGCVLLLLLGSQWYILFNVIAGASAIPHEFQEVADVYQMPRKKRWRDAYLPAVYPFLLTGMVTAAGGAWNATIVSEYFQSKSDTIIAFGLGSTISDATANANFPLLAASVVTMAVFVVLLNQLVWKRLSRVAESKYSLNV